MPHCPTEQHLTEIIYQNEYISKRNDQHCACKLKNRRNTNKDDHFRESNKVFEVSRTNIGHTTKVVDACLLSNSRSCPRSVKRIDSDFRVTKHDLWWRFSRIRGFKTFAGLNALGPCVIKNFVAEISALLEPSTTTSATTVFSGCLDGTALATSSTAAAGHRK